MILSYIRLIQNIFLLVLFLLLIQNLINLIKNIYYENNANF